MQRNNAANDNTKPSARVGRKAQGSPRDSRVAEISQRYGDPFFVAARCAAQRNVPNGGEIMNARLLKNLKYAAACHILISAFIATSIQAAQAEELFLFRSPGATIPPSGDAPRTIQQKNPLKPDKKGGLLIQCGSARFTVAYNAPLDQFDPSEQQQNSKREHNATINGISLTASLSF